MAVVNLELPILILIAGMGLALAAWLLATFAQSLRGYRSRGRLGLFAVPVGGWATWFSAFSAAGQWCVWPAGWIENKPFLCSTIWSRNTRNAITIENPNACVSS